MRERAIAGIAGVLVCGGADSRMDTSFIYQADGLRRGTGHRMLYRHTTRECEMDVSEIEI
jgi:hypothetical protein